MLAENFLTFLETLIMAIIERKKDDKPLDIDGKLVIPAMHLPDYRKLVAAEKGVEKRIMIQVRGGIGDYICAEPAIRFACERFNGEVYLATITPEFFRHLPIAKSFDPSKEMPIWQDYLNFHTLFVGDEIGSHFFTHMYSHVIDYHTLAMWRIQLSNKDRCVKLCPTEGEMALAKEAIQPSDILIHPGRTWETRTFPKEWWDGVTDEIKKNGCRPVIIGAESVNGCGTIDVNNDGCLDLRGKLSLMESVAVTQVASVVLTNDSAPLHMAATGNAWIGYISTVKPPDLLLHYRNGGELGWRMQNHSTGWLCQDIDYTPTNPEKIDFRIGNVEKWLPNPMDYARWAVEKINGRGRTEDIGS